MPVAELAYSGKDTEAGSACEIGLVNRCYPGFNAIYSAAQTQTMAHEMADSSPLAVPDTRFSLQQSGDLTTVQSLLLHGMYTMMTSLQNNDWQEAVAAFEEKPQPDFSGT